MSTFSLDWEYGHNLKGKPARLVCRDVENRSGNNCLWLVSEYNGEEYAFFTDETGRGAGVEISNNPKPKKKFWVNIFSDGSSDTYESEEEAKDAREVIEANLMYGTEVHIVAQVVATEGDTFDT